MNLAPKRDYFNGIADQWDGFPAPPDTADMTARFVALAVPEQAERILDVGCGTGILVPLLRASGNAPRHLVELDLAERMLAQSRLKSGGRPEVMHVCAAAQSLPFAPATFDVALCFNALPHLTPIDTTLRAVLACLRPGGLLSVCHLMGSSALNSFHAAMGGVVAGDHLPSAEHLGAMLRRLNCEIGRCEDTPGWYLVQALKLAQ
jgi:ubiquinone/menaquinone biosynthesis C-methylase UbiE